MKIPLLLLKKILREEIQSLSIKEESDSTELVEESLSSDSLDSQIDNYLIKFENQMTSSSDGTQMESKFSLKRYLFEADKDEEETPSEEESDETSASDDEKSDDTIAPATTKNLNVRGFAKHVARMVENYDNLFDIRGTMLRRALNFVKSGYGDSQADQLEDTLERDFKVSLEKKDIEYDAIPPNASGAGPEVA